MKKIFLVFIIYAIAIGANAQKKLEEIIPKAKMIAPYTYELSDIIKKYPKCKLQQKDLDKFFSKHKDTYQLVDKWWWWSGSFDKIQFINLKEQKAYQEEYKSSGREEKATIFRNAQTPEQWINTRKQYPEFRITTPNIDIVRALRKDGMTIPDFWEIFPEYKDDVSFKDAVLHAVYNRNGIMEYLNLYNDINSAKSYVLQKNQLIITMQDFIDIFEDRQSLENWVLAHFRFLDLRTATREICESLGAQAVEKYFDKYAADDRYPFIFLDNKELVAYIQCTQNYTKATELICKRLADITQAEAKGTWFDQMFSPVAPVFYYAGYIEHKYAGIGHANWAIQHIQDETCREKIRSAITKAYNDIERYEYMIDETRAKYAGYKQTMCDNCIIDADKTTIAYNETKEWLIGTYTENHPGEIVMKNGIKYTFYLDSYGKWWIPGWFSARTFENPKEMLKYFLEECQKAYCR
jgi:hypothetical protein